MQLPYLQKKKKMRPHMLNLKNRAKRQQDKEAMRIRIKERRSNEKKKKKKKRQLCVSP